MSAGAAEPGASSGRAGVDQGGDARNDRWCEHARCNRSEHPSDREIGPKAEKKVRL